MRGRSGAPVIFQGGTAGLTLEQSSYVTLEDIGWTGAERTDLRLARDGGPGSSVYHGTQSVLRHVPTKTGNSFFFFNDGSGSYLDR